MMLYGILAVFAGVVAFAAYGMLDGNWAELADENGLFYGLTLDQTSTAVMFIGVFILLSGLCALVSGFMTGKRENYRLSLVLCIAASVLPLFMALGVVDAVLFGIILCVIGLYVTNRIRENGQCFAS